MTLAAPERHTISVGDTDVVRVRYNDRLDTSEVLTGTPTVVEVTTTDLTLASKAVNSAAYTDSDGVAVGIGQAVIFSVKGGTVAHSPYTILITATTNATPAKTLARNIYLSFE